MAPCNSRAGIERQRGSGGAVSDARLAEPLVEEGALAPVTRPGDITADLTGSRDGC
jgi:hypothetical protein